MVFSGGLIFSLLCPLPCPLPLGAPACTQQCRTLVTVATDVHWTRELKLCRRKDQITEVSIGDFCVVSSVCVCWGRGDSRRQEGQGKEKRG